MPPYLVQSSDEMNVPEVEAFIEGKTLFRRTRVENWTAAGISGWPATFSSWPVTFLLSNTKKLAGRLPKVAGHAPVYAFGPVLPSEEKVQAFPCNGCAEGLYFPLSWMRSVAQIVRSTLHFVKSCFFSSCCFAYQVVCRADVFRIFDSLLSD